VDLVGLGFDDETAKDILKKVSADQAAVDG